MEPFSVFSGISEEERDRMRACFHAQELAFCAGACMMELAVSGGRVGILLSGSAELSSADADGYNSILEYIEPGDLFGAPFTPPVPGMDHRVTAVTAARAMFFDYAHLIRQCPNACAHHSRLVGNVLELTAKKAQSLSEHVNVLSRRTIRQKLIAHFALCRARSGGGAFVLPMTLTALADYLSVDRSAMMRELKRMKEEGLLAFRGREVELLTSVQ